MHSQKSSTFSVDKQSEGNDNKGLSHAASLKCLSLNYKDNSAGSGKLRSCPPWL